MKINTNKSVKGFTLVDCAVALVVSLVGLLAVYSLVTVSVRVQTVSKDLSQANSLARAKVEELKNETLTAGGDLSNNATGYFDNPSPLYVRRWQVTDDTLGTKTVTVRVYPNVSLLPELTIVSRVQSE